MLQGSREQNPVKRWLASCPSRGEATSSATGTLVLGGAGGKRLANHTSRGFHLRRVGGVGPPPPTAHPALTACAEQIRASRPGIQEPSREGDPAGTGTQESAHVPTSPSHLTPSAQPECRVAAAS